MANDKVMFKRGSQANLAAYINGTTPAAEGTFYLTSDTNRLYVGKNGKAVPVNQGVITVESISKLPTGANIEAGCFYYATLENVLCVYSGQTHGWVQINPDTNTKVTNRVASGKTETDFVVVTDDGCKNLTLSPKKLLCV